MSLIVSDKKRVVLGLGKTGFSCVQFLSEKNQAVQVWDTRENPPYLTRCKEQFPNVEITLGELNAEKLSTFDQIIISPGLAMNHPAIEFAKNNGVQIIGDVDLFVQNCDAKIIAITGSNAKSTVTTLTGHLLNQAGINAKVGGNLGEPMLQLLDDETQVYVLELSSFQLETTHQLNADVATVLNVSEDHMDRYESFAHYHLAKHRIFKGCKSIVVNKDDALSQPLVSEGYPTKFFTQNTPDINQFGLIKENDKTYLAKGFKKIIDTAELKLLGEHNFCNYLSALALCESIGVDLEDLKNGLTTFTGLKHRCEKIAVKNDVVFINDSKATNVGATLAAIEGLKDQNIHLILGGVTKGADFSDLKPVIEQYVGSISLIGDGADELFSILQGSANMQKHDSLQESVLWLAKQAKANEVVLLSPACASFDMFENFEARGLAFEKIVEEIV